MTKPPTGNDAAKHRDERAYRSPPVSFPPAVGRVSVQFSSLRTLGCTAQEHGLRPELHVPSRYLCIMSILVRLQVVYYFVLCFLLPTASFAKASRTWKYRSEIPRSFFDELIHAKIGPRVAASGEWILLPTPILSTSAGHGRCWLALRR